MSHYNTPNVTMCLVFCLKVETVPVTTTVSVQPQGGDVVTAPAKGELKWPLCPTAIVYVMICIM